MKKISLSIAIVFLSFLGKAQVFTEGRNFVNIGYGLGNTSKYTINNYQVSSFGPLLIGFEHAYKENEAFGIKLSPSGYRGAIGFGGLIGYSRYNSTYSSLYSSYNYTYKSTNIFALVRAAYHLDINIEKLDLYAGFGFGVNSGKYKSTSNDIYWNANPEYTSRTYFDVIGQFYAGARYMLKENFGVYTELGAGVSYMHVGLTFGL